MVTYINNFYINNTIVDYKLGNFITSEYNYLLNLSVYSFTLEKVEELREDILKSGLISVEKDYSFIGRMMPRVLMNVVGGEEKQGTNNIAQSVYFATDYYEMIENLPELSRRLVKNNPDIIVLVDSFSSGPPVFSDVSYVIFGDDPGLLKSLGEELELIINNSPDINVTKSATSDSITNVEFELNSSNISLSGQNANYLVNEMFTALSDAAVKNKISPCCK